MSEAAMAALMRAEQADLDLRYARLDEVRAETEHALTQLRRSSTAGTPAARVEREAFLTLTAQHRQRLAAVEERLCIGRLAMADGSDRYVGRIGLTDAAGVRLLLDWRAPAAQPFYRATPAAPDGVVSRRHLITTGRRITGVSDEVLDLDRFSAAAADTAPVSADGVLMLALNAQRTGRMRDIVATIQAEQDEIIRAPMAGVLVVQGGPGTGKTVVALHRAAYLLYAHADRLSRSGVLVVGPNSRFLHYIEQVLPSLGETGVVLATAGQLYPGVDAQATDSPQAAMLKGDLRMARLLAAAVRARQRIPADPVRLEVEGHIVTLLPRDVEQARGRAQHSRKPHNEARVRFVGDLLERLAGRLAKAQRVDLDADTRPELINALRNAPDVRRELNLCWMPLTPERLLRDLYADPDALARLAPWLSAAERGALHRSRSAPWTPADVALLDEAAELLGPAETTEGAARSAAEAAERAQEVEYAGRVLDMIADMEPDAPRMTTADALAERYGPGASRQALVDEAVGDRNWAYGHLVIDEAQELSAMQWRLLMRRCPSRSMTVVGDIAQTGSPAGAQSWGQMLDRYLGGRWRLAELSVNYRTPGRIVEVATALLAEAGIPATAMTSARQGDWPPTAERVAGELTEAVSRAALTELAELGDGTAGRLAVIAAPADQPALIEALEALPGAGERLAVLTPAQCKGLEFDAVVLVEPAAILAAGPRGASDLYVAMSRATQRLRILHRRPLPAALAGLPGPQQS